MSDAIMVRFDLAHADRLDKALSVAADLRRNYDARVCPVGVTATTRGSGAHSARQDAEGLDAFAMARGASCAVKALSRALTSRDPAADLGAAQLRAVRDTGADLVVMGAHAPGLRDSPGLSLGALWPLAQASG